MALTLWELRVFDPAKTIQDNRLSWVQDERGRSGLRPGRS